VCDREADFGGQRRVVVDFDRLHHPRIMRAARPRRDRRARRGADATRAR
jgi:hypothetical protein